MSAAPTTLQRQPPRRAPGWWRTLFVAYWLGWKIESNWTDPFLFAVYSIVRPLGGVLILVVMFFVVVRGRQGPLLGFMVVGSAFWPFVLNGMQGMAWAVISDREHWRTMRAVYSAPISFRAYLVGRALAQSTAALAAAAITLAAGRWAFGVPMSLAAMRLPYAAAAFALGIVAVIGMGLLVTGVALSVAGDAWRMPEGVGAALYLLCGAIFPVAVLPAFLRPIAEAVPLTWWLEAMRRGLLGAGAARSFPHLGDGQVLAVLALGAAAAALVGAAGFALAERRARVLGILDQESAY